MLSKSDFNENRGRKTNRARSMLGFHHTASLGYQDGVPFDGTSYDNAEPYDEGFYSTDSSLTSPHSEGPLGAAEPEYGLYDMYVPII